MYSPQNWRNYITPSTKICIIVILLTISRAFRNFFSAKEIQNEKIYIVWVGVILCEFDLSGSGLAFGDEY
jgi:hypothetical protein